MSPDPTTPDTPDPTTEEHPGAMLDSTTNDTPPLSRLDHIAMSLISPDMDNMRRALPNAEINTAFEGSVATLGVLVPILLRPQGEGFRIVHGHRRYFAALVAGHATIPAYVRAMSDADAAAAQQAENTARAAVLAIDQWRATVRLQEVHGWDLGTAARAIGIEGRMLARMAHLGRMHPAVIAAIDKHGMPSASVLAKVSMAPHETQAAAVERGFEYGRFSWEVVMRGCAMTRIPRSRAIFDPLAADPPLRFDQDLFASPDSDDEWTTGDVPRFLALQGEALAEEVTRRKEAGEPIDLAQWSPAGGEVVIPPGFMRVFGPTDDGTKALPKKGKKRRIAAVVGSGWRVGEISWLLVEALPKPAKAKPGAAPAPVVDAPKKVAPAFTKAGLELVAQGKTQAVRERLAQVGPIWGPDQAAAALVLALSAGNVEVRGIPGESFRHTHFGDLAARLLTPMGTLRTEAVGEVAAEALARILLAVGPDNRQAGSGRALDWIAGAISAEQTLPRFDTPEFLATVSGSELRRLALAVGVPAHGKVADLKIALVGRLPDWRPATFAADLPEPDGPEPDGPEPEEETPEGEEEKEAATDAPPAAAEAAKDEAEEEAPPPMAEAAPQPGTRRPRQRRKVVETV